MLKKLRVKFLCFTMALVFVMLCVIFGTVYGLTAQKLEDDSLQLMHTLAGPHVFSGEKRPMVRVPYLVLQQTAEGSWSAQGSDHYDLTDQAFLNTLLQDVSGQGSRDGVLKAYNLRFLRTDGPNIRYVFMDISAERATLKHLVQTCILIGILSLLLFFGISLLLADLALRPVEKVWQEQKQFVADASHELKTPLAVIMTNAELLADADHTGQAHQQFEKNILTVAGQMQHLVEGLLELARLDSVSPALAPLDFSMLAEEALLPFEPVFFENSMQLCSRIGPSLWVKGSQSHLQQILEIFLDNALKYAAPGPVTVTLQQTGSHALLQVENLGTPLSSQEAKDIFLRFYRADPARSRNGSYGLGLSIAQKIVGLHGGRIWAEGTAAGNRFSVLLPLCAKEQP